jgi:homoserine O-acetyltransferase
MVSYRTPLGYQKKFGRALTDESGPSYGRHAPWQVKSYLEYQGKKFLDRFDAVTYVKLTEQVSLSNGLMLTFTC